jgi:two-component system, response regulator PdtaR
VKGSRILIVEDNLLVAMDLEMTLEDFGYQVTSIVPTGEEGIQELEGSPVDLVIMDIRLAGVLDGIQTAKHIRQRWEIPIIFVTAAGKQELDGLQGSMESYDVIAKPFREEQLRSAIDKALNRRERCLSR